MIYKKDDGNGGKKFNLEAFVKHSITIIAILAAGWSARASFESINVRLTRIEAYIELTQSQIPDYINKKDMNNWVNLTKAKNPTLNLPNIEK